MILVTLGTQDKEYPRLLNAVQKQIEDKVITDQVIVQAGCTKFASKEMKIFDLISREEMDQYIASCDLLITHGGVGSIVYDGLRNHKVVIAAPRLKKYGEHTNDHQLQIVSEFEKSGYILAYYDGDDLKEVLDKAKHFIPKEYQSNTPNMIALIEKEIR